MNADHPQPAVTKAWDLVDQAKTQIDNLSPAELESELEAGDTVVVDIRDVRELYLKGKIPGAVHAPRGMLEFWIDPASEYYRKVFDPSKRYVLYCAGGGRSALAAKVMKDMGYPDIGHLEPGFGGWEADGREIEDCKEGAKWVPAES
jgi:rhodanese-related sulfurtransferase